MKNRENRGVPSADLLACFPSRAHLALLPKPICSPARSSEPTKRNPQHRRKRSTGGGLFSGAGQLSPVPWAKTSRQIKVRDGGGGPENSEPTSPKVTCAGQIKVRPSGPSSCRNWQSVMEEIERIHSDRKQRTIGFKKDVMHFLTCLRTIKFDFNFRCFGSFPEQALSSDDEEEEDEDEEKDEKEDAEAHEEEGSNTAFSKWFMVLEEDQRKTAMPPASGDGAMVPPPNALLLMRCRSAPAQSRLKRLETEDEEDGDLQQLKEDEDEDEEEKAPKETEDSNKRKKKRDSLEMVMKHDSDFYKLGSDDEIAKETWVDGGLMESLCRSRSCKR